MKSEGEFDALQCCDPDFWSIGSDYLKDTNLNINGPFYCRQGVKKLFLFIEEKVIKKVSKRLDLWASRYWQVNFIICICSETSTK